MSGTKSVERIEPSTSDKDIETVILLDEDDDLSPKEIIIDLDTYSRNKKKRASTRCVNCECEGGLDLREAPLFCLNFYRVKYRPKLLQEICSQCYDIVVKCYDNLTTSLKDGKFLMDQEFPMRSDYVEIDSDEEIEVDQTKRVVERFGEETQRFVADNLPDTLNNLLHDMKFEEQVDYSFDYVKKHFDAMDSEITELEEKHKDIQSIVDRIRNQLYNNFRPEIRQLEPMELDDSGLTSASSELQPSSAIFPKEVERRVSRTVSQPVSQPRVPEERPTRPPPALVPTKPQPNPQDDQDVQIVQTTEQPSNLDIPEKGELERTKPVAGEMYYAMRHSIFSAWGKGRLMEMIPGKDDLPCNVMYKVRFESKGKGPASTKLVQGKQLAYSTPSKVQLVVGTRVIAVFNDESTIKRESFFIGIVAEPLSVLNNYRYLIFFDDGYAQYVSHKKVLLVVEASKNVWEDIHPDSRLFIKKYLENYPERPMVKVQANQVMKTEWNGKWWIARVMRVEGSLVQMYFDADARSEWIYRGSTRLGPLFLEMQAATNRQEKGPHIPKMQNVKKNEPYVEYTRSQTDKDGTVSETSYHVSQPSVQPRAVARKSTNRPPNMLPNGAIPRPATTGNMIPFLPTPQVQQPQSKVVYFTPKSVIAPKVLNFHLCALSCRDFVVMPVTSLRGYNPLSKPLLCGWYRMIFKFKKNKKMVMYRTPCGRVVRSMPELHRYLRLTKSDMSVDQFDFEYWVHCLAEFTVDSTFRNIRDISNGVENVPIPCVNYVDNTTPDFTRYSTMREPMEGVKLNLSEEFLCGCDCEDDCADKTKCACWQLTIREARTLNKRIPDDLIGYTYKRLPDFVTTGIYECNSRCKCGPTCLNRVVQHPLQLKLQLFKTANRGWGIRCLNDIPQGAFICVYAGSLLTDKMANEGGVNYGDEYLAELDYIEVVERQKDGYESDVEEDSQDEDGSAGKKNTDDNDDDEDYTDDDYEDDEQNVARVSNAGKKAAKFQDREFICSANPNSGSTIRTRSRKRLIGENANSDENNQIQSDKSEKETVDESVIVSDDDEAVREPSRFDPSSETHPEDSYVPKFRSVRKMFGEDEVCYIMDAKNTGNIGRFLNHSCSPNVFVQNVFVDTHDLRFPWVAFFAMTYIRAGTELTWNYNYDVGSVPGKVIFCHCGSSECRGRLL